MTMTTEKPAATGNLAAALLPELDAEATTTRKCLERVPVPKLDWKPHAKSMSLGDLATFVAVLPSWITTTIAQNELDLSGPPQMAERMTSAKALVELFDRNVAEARQALRGASDDHMLGPWTLISEGKKLFTQPRLAVARIFAINHLVHHRGQLSVYLRMNDVAVPSLYGPSADEGSW